MHSRAVIRPKNFSPLSITWTLVGALFLCVCTYVYFVAVAVLDVVVERDHLQHASALQSEISLLESQQMVARHVISSRIAETAETAAAQSPLFVSRDGATVAFHKSFE